MVEHFGDIFGKITPPPPWIKCVDNAIVSENILDQILYFSVNEFDPTLSDCNCLLLWELSASFTTQADNNQNTCKMQLIEPHFKWSEDSLFQFQEALTSVDIQKNLSDLEKADIQH